jgi:ankyrin repeat protein
MCYDLYDPELPRFNSDRRMATDRPPLYYVSLARLSRIVGPLLDRGADVNTQGGYYGSALQAASARGHDKIVQMLQARLELLHRPSKVRIVIKI